VDNRCLKHRITDISFAYVGTVQLNIEDSHYGILYKEEIIYRMYRKFRMLGSSVLVPVKSSMSES
jgi:hypothetical protein